MATTSLSVAGFAGVSLLPATAGLSVVPTPASDSATAVSTPPAQDSYGVPRSDASTGVGGASADLVGTQPNLAGAVAADDGTEAPGATSNNGQVDVAVKKANLSLSASGTQLVFVFDDQQRRSVVKLVDIQTQKVVQEIPSGAMPGTASALSGDSTSGVLIDTKA